MTDSELEGQSGPPPRPARKWVLILILTVGLCVVAWLVLAWPRGGVNSAHSPVVTPAEEGPSTGSSRPNGVASDRVQNNSSLDRVPPRPLPLTAAMPTGPEPSADARQLIKSLSEIDLQQGELSPETAEGWHRNLEELLQLGTEAIPALQEFLQKNEDVRFDSGSGTNLLGEPSLRIAVLKLLMDLPGPENLELQEQALRTSKDPDEIVLLATQLDMQEPEKYTQVIVDSVIAALDREQSGKSPERDVSPLIKILKKYQNPGVK